MKAQSGILFLILVLHLAATAGDASNAAECAQYALKFSGTPRELTLAELDGLRLCINEQRRALEFERQEQQAKQARLPRRYRPYSPADF